MITFRYLLLDQLVNVDEFSPYTTSRRWLPCLLDLILLLRQMFIKIKKSMAHHIGLTPNSPTFLLCDYIWVMHHYFLMRKAPNERMVVRHFQTQTLT